MTSEMERQMNNAAMVRSVNKLTAHLSDLFGPPATPQPRIIPKPISVPEPVAPPEPRYRRVILPRMEDLDESVLC